MDVRGGSGCALMLSFHPASADQLEGSPLVGIPSFVQLEEGGGGRGRAHYVAIAKVRVGLFNLADMGHGMQCSRVECVVMRVCQSSCRRQPAAPYCRRKPAAPYFRP